MRMKYAIAAAILLTAATIPMISQRGNIDYDQIRSAARRGTTGTLFQMGAGSWSAGHMLVYDSAGNAIDGGTPNKVKTCVVVTGDPGAASPALADDNDSPVACGNTYGSDMTITSVSCWANAGSPTVTPILTGGTGTSILTGALTCGTGAWAAGTLNGSPVVHSFSANGATCSSTPCTVDVNITTAGGTAKYLVVRITGTL